MIYTVYTWPKFGAAALLLAAFVGWLSPPTADTPNQFVRHGFLGACAALAWLAHGGVAFS